MVRTERPVRPGDPVWISNLLCTLDKLICINAYHRAFSSNLSELLGHILEMLISPSAYIPLAWQICSYRLSVMSTQSRIFLNNKSSNMQREVSSFLFSTVEGLVQAMNYGNGCHSHPYNTIGLLNARKQNLYSQKRDFDSSAVDRLMHSPLWCACMTDGLFSLFKICIYSSDK